MYDVTLARSYFAAQTDTPYAEITIGDMLRRQAGLFTDAPAVKELTPDGEIGRIWSYAELLTDAERLAAALASRHEPDARIAVYAYNSPEWLLLELASALAGLVLVTVNPSYQKRELKYVLEQSRAEAIYYVEAFRGNPLKAIADEVCSELPRIKRRILLTDHQNLFEGSEQGVPPQVSPDDVCQIQYTSGTTGFPKGALLHHRGLVQNSADVMRRLEMRAGDVFIHHMPFFHTTGCAILALGGLGVGATMLLAPAFDPAMIVRVIERERPRFLLGVPTMLVALMEEIQRVGADVSSIERMMSGGSMVAPELIRKGRQIFGANIQVVYGQTECSPIITLTRHDDPERALTETTGQPLPHIETAILDPRTNEILPIGQQGEICTRGYHVMAGYNDDPKSTANTIDSDGWLHTGDLGRLDENGFLTITGRVKEMIIRGGENLFPVEIENAMLEHPAIAEVAVVGVPDEKWGEQVACFMRARDEARPSVAELRAFMRERISPQKTPVYWIWIDEWPLTGSGKIQKFVLAEKFEEGAYEVLKA